MLVFSQFTTLLALVRTTARRAGGRRTRTSTARPGIGRRSSSGSRPIRPATLFLISLKAGGVGLNLTAADYVFLLDPWWNPAVEAQAIDRAHRIGQTQPVFAYRLIARGHGRGEDPRAPAGRSASSPTPSSRAKARRSRPDGGRSAECCSAEWGSPAPPPTRMSGTRSGERSGSRMPRRAAERGPLGSARSVPGFAADVTAGGAPSPTKPFRSAMTERNRGNGGAEGSAIRPARRGPGGSESLPERSGSEGISVDRITLSSNTPGSSNTLIFWLREVTTMRQAA